MDVTPARVLYNRHETPSVIRLGLAWDALGRGAQAARFAMLAFPDRGVHLLPRPFSISDVYRDPDGEVVTEFLYKPVGKVTRRMAELSAGAELHVGGLCGNGFPAAAPERRPVLLAGGIGNAPFAYQVRELLEGPHGQDPARIHLFLAGRSADDLWIQDVVRDAGVTVVEVTEDGSRGERGRVTDAFLARRDALGDVEVFACGPEPMLAAVQALALEHGFPCHLSIEEWMACAYGVCNACVVEERADGLARGEGRYRRACVEGPVFEAQEIWL